MQTVDIAAVSFTNEVEIAEVCAEEDWHYLDASPAYIGDVAFVGQSAVGQGASSQGSKAKRPDGTK